MLVCDFQFEILICSVLTIEALILEHIQLFGM